MTATAILPQALEIGLVQIRVSNLERSLSFYQNVIGLKILRQQGRTAELTADGRQVLLVLREIEQAQVLRRNSVAGLYHFAILLPDRPSLGLVLRNLIDSGISVGQGITWSAKPCTLRTLIITASSCTATGPVTPGSMKQQAMWS